MSEEKLSPVATKIEVRRSMGGLIFSLVLLVLIIVVAGAGYFMIARIQTEHKGIGGNIDRDDKRVHTLTVQLTSHQEQLATIQTQLATVASKVVNLEVASVNKNETIKQTLADFFGLQSEKLAATKKELLLSIQQIKKQLSKTRSDWLIADAEYLLSIANQRLHLLGDFHTAIEALQAADQRLRESGDIGVIKVREQLIKELASLKEMGTLDIVGVYSRIKLLTEKAETLTILLPYTGKPSTDTTDLTEQLEISGIPAIDNALVNLQKLVTIRRSDQPVKAITSSNNADFIRQQLKVKLQIAIISLVNNSAKLYLSSMDDAAVWVQNSFTKNKISQYFINEINTLKDIPIHNKAPDISQSLKMLRSIGKLRLTADTALFSGATDIHTPAVKIK